MLNLLLAHAEDTTGHGRVAGATNQRWDFIQEMEAQTNLCSQSSRALSEQLRHVAKAGAAGRRLLARNKQGRFIELSHGLLNARPRPSSAPASQRASNALPSSALRLVTTAPNAP